MSTPVVKTYVLLKSTEPNAPVFLRTSPTQRVRLNKRPVDAVHLQVSVMDRDGKNRTLRYKANCDTIYMDEQIKLHNIPANEKFTDKEREIRYFRNGVLMTNNPTFQKFLESHPEYDGFWKPLGDKPAGMCDEITEPKFTLYEKDKEDMLRNQSIKLRIGAAGMVMAIESLEEAEVLMKRLFGGSYKAPKTLEACQNVLVEYVDEADEKELLDMTRTEMTEDEKVDILIGRAVEKGIIKFDHADFPDEVVLIKNGKALPMKKVSSEYLQDERERFLAEFLISDLGKPYYDDIEAMLKDAETKTTKKPSKQPATV